MYKPTERTINWGKDINFIKLFYTKVSCKRRPTTSLEEQFLEASTLKSNQVWT